MPTAKARYVGDGAGKIPRDFTDELKKTLRAYYLKQDAEQPPAIPRSVECQMYTDALENSEIIEEAKSDLATFTKNADQIVRAMLTKQQGEAIKSKNTARAAAIGKLLKDGLPKEFYPSLYEAASERKIFGHPADAFVNEILAEARWAISQLMWQELAVTKQEIRAEYTDLLDTLKYARDNLRKLSSGFDCLLGVDANPLGVAGSLDLLIRQVNAADASINALPRKKRPDEAKHDIAVEMAIRVLRVIKEHGIKIAATANKDFGYKSDAVIILEAIGDDIRLELDELTWQGIIIEAKKAAPDL